jgi:hypothetical protein
MAIKQPWRQVSTLSARTKRCATSIGSARQSFEPTLGFVQSKPRRLVVPRTRLSGIGWKAKDPELRQYDRIECSAERERGLCMPRIGGTPQNQPRGGNVTGLQIFLTAPH